MKNGKIHDISVGNRAPSRMTITASSGRSSQASMSGPMAEEKLKIRKLMETGSGNKVQQTLQMILMVIIPIIALLSLTAITLVSALQTSSQANKAKTQMKHIFRVR